MVGSADDEQPRCGSRETEEGEVGYHAGTGSDTDTDDEDARYYLQSRHDNDEWADVSAGSARGNSPACSFGTDWTISDVHAGGSVSAAVAREGFSCTVCRREFSSSKAVHGHMRVHALAAKEEKRVVAAVASGAASAVEEVGDSVSASTDIVAADMPGLYDDTITPVQSACGSNPVVGGGSSARSSVEPSQSGAAAPEQVPVAPTPAATPPQQAAAAAAPQQATYIPLMVPASSQQLVPVGVQHPRQAPEGRGFSCRECGRWFPSHQGLGGHVAGHKNRRLAAEAAAAAAAGIDPLHMTCRGGARPERSHACKICGAEYPSGVSLGGHMRKHYNGKPIVPRKRLRLSPAELALALPLQRAPPAVEAPIAAPPPPPPQLPPGTFRLFGVTIVQQPRNEEEEAEEEHRPVEDQQ